MLHKDYYRKCSSEKKLLVVSLKGLVAKMNWVAVNFQLQSNSDYDYDNELIVGEKLSGVQLNKVTWSSWLLSERVVFKCHMEVSLWRED
jgi:hypothetical protein